MTCDEIIKALELILDNDKDCFRECIFPKDMNVPCEKDGQCFIKIKEETFDLIKRQQATLTAISDLIVENTYPGFDKEGKPVCIWNTDGYKKIENLLKAGADNV